MFSTQQALPKRQQPHVIHNGRYELTERYVRSEISVTKRDGNHFQLKGIVKDDIPINSIKEKCNMNNVNHIRNMNERIIRRVVYWEELLKNRKSGTSM